MIQVLHIAQFRLSDKYRSIQGELHRLKNWIHNVSTLSLVKYEIKSGIKEGLKQERVRERAQECWGVGVYASAFE